MKIKKYLIFITLLLFTFSCVNEQLEEKHLKNGIYYEIFVRSYADSNGDGIGDLKGIEHKLEEIKKIGFDRIWLTPIFESPSYHKYDVVDYYKIDKEYGSNEDFKQLVEKAHRLGIKVIIDLPINHTSSEHFWFKDIKNNRDSKYRDYYRIGKKEDKNFNFNIAGLGAKSWHELNEDEMYYGIFWSGMPDLNFESKKVREEVHKIAKFWIEEADIDGYRIDAALHIYGVGEYPKNIKLLDENIKWWKEFKDELNKIKKENYVVGEIWAYPDMVAKFYNVFDSNFNFEFSEKIIINGIIRENGKEMNSKLKNIYEKYEKINKDFIDAPFLTNHDQSRISEKLFSENQLKLAASILLTLPGNPFIYYGEELGMKGKKPDEQIREPYIWGDKYQTTWEDLIYNGETENYYKQMENENSLLNYYIKWINIRKNNDEIKYGKYIPVEYNNNKIFAFKMAYKGKEKLILHNLSKENQRVIISNKEYNLKGYESRMEE